MVDFENGYGIMVGMEPSNDNSFGSLGSGEGGVGGVVGANGVNSVDGVSSPVMGVSGMGAGSAMLMSSGGNGTGAPMAFTAPVSSGTGDIVIGGDEKKSKKGLFVGLMVLVVLLVIGGIVAVMMLGGGQQSGSSADIVFNDTTKSEFLKFANYTLNEESSEDLLVSVSRGDMEYAINIEPLEITKRHTFLEECNTLFQKYLVTVDMSDDATPIGLISSNYVLNNNLKLLLWISQKPPISMEELMTDYAEFGPEETKNKITEYYSNYDGGNTFLRSFVNVEVEMAENMLSYLIFYDENNCIRDNAIDVSCIDSLTIPEDLITKGDSIMFFENNLYNEISDSETRVVEEIWKIAEMLEVINGK